MDTADAILDPALRAYATEHAYGDFDTDTATWSGGSIVLGLRPFWSDVRPPLEYRAGHIPTARSIPIDELAARLAELPREQEIVAYCRGPYCVFADEAVALLTERGYRARRLAVGLPDWRALGYPVATAAGGGS